MKVKAAIARAHGAPLQLEGVELDEPRDDEILVKLVASGVAQADLDAIDGRLAMPLPFVPGCEGAGIVERVGADVTDLRPGDAVVVAFASCGACRPCRDGHARRCDDFGALNLSGRRLDGSTPFSAGGHDGWRIEAHAINGSFFGQSSFSTHLVCRAASAIKVATGAPLEVLACLGGELLLGAGTILHGFRPRPDDPLLIVGADAVGFVATMAARTAGVKMILVADRDERRRSLATALGATVTIHAEDNVADLVRSLAGDGARFALETTGHPAARAACLDSLARGGICAFVQANAADDDISPAADVSVIPADGRAAPERLIPELVALHRRGALPLEQLVDFFPFEHVNDALDALRRGDVAKPVLRFSIGTFDDLDRAKTEGAANDAPEEKPVDDDARDRPALVKP